MFALRHPRLISLTLDDNRIRSLQGLVVPEGFSRAGSSGVGAESTALVFLRTLSVRNNDLENLDGIAAAAVF